MDRLIEQTKQTLSNESEEETDRFKKLQKKYSWGDGKITGEKLFNDREYIKKAKEVYDLPVWSGQGLDTETLKLRLAMMVPLMESINEQPRSGKLESSLFSILQATDKILTALLNGEEPTNDPDTDIPLFIAFINESFLAHAEILKKIDGRDLLRELGVKAATENTKHGLFRAIEYDGVSPNDAPSSANGTRLLYFILENKKPSIASITIKKIHQKYISSSPSRN